MEEGVGNAPTSGLSRSCFRDRRSQLVSACLPEMVSAAGFAPAVTRSQAGHVAATPRAVRPGVLGAHQGLCFMGNAGPTHLEPVSRGKKRKLADSKGVAPSAFPQTTGCSAD